MIHWAQAVKEEPEQDLVSQPLHAIHFAPGATPIWFVPSLPTIVPMVCVPWLLLSQGVAPHSPVGSFQLPTWVNEPPPRLPRYWFTSAGWLYCTPVSMLATTIPVPVAVGHTWSARILLTPQAMACVPTPPVCGVGIL